MRLPLDYHFADTAVHEEEEEAKLRAEVERERSKRVAVWKKRSRKEGGGGRRGVEAAIGQAGGVRVYAAALRL